MSCAESTLACRRPEVSMAGVRPKRSIASATKPPYHAFRAASISPSRERPGASASRSTRS
jgi:hypothetical protein